MQKTTNSIKLYGLVRLDIFGKNGKLKDTTGWIENTITTTGKAEMANLGAGSGTAFTYLAVGLSATPTEHASATALYGEITAGDLARATAVVTRVSTDTTNDTLQLYKEWTASATRAVEEVGIFNASAVGVMLGRKLTTTKTVDNGEKLQATYKVKIA